jgi:hypothetical protein
MRPLLNSRFTAGTAFSSLKRVEPRTWRVHESISRQRVNERTAVCERIPLLAQTVCQGIITTGFQNLTDEQSFPVCS